MKLLIIFALLFFTDMASAELDDKDLHFAVSAAISATTYGISRYSGQSKMKSFAIAVSTTMLVGIAKEVYDPVFDKNDIAADFLGAVTAPVLIILF